MRHLDVAAALVDNRHNAHTVLHIADTKLADPTLEHSDLVTLVTTLVGIIHDAGHRSTRVDTMLDLFAATPDTLAERGAKFVMFPATDIAHPALVRMVYDGAIEGTTKADRVWIVKALPGNLFVVSLEGSGTPNRTIGIVGGTLKDAHTLRDALDTLDGR